MASRVIASLFIIAAAAGALSAQSPKSPSPAPYTSLLITARGVAPDQSLLYRVDLSIGKVATLFNEKLGALTDVTMDRHNSGFAVVHQGSKGTGVYFLKREGSAVSLHEAETIRQSSANLCCLQLSGEDNWVTGTAIADGAGRIGEFRTGPATLVEARSFPGQEVSEILVDRNNASLVLALNGQAGGVVYAYDPAGPAFSSTLAACTGFITDLAQDPGSGGLLVSTNDPRASFVFVDPEASPTTVRTFRFPAAAFPAGLPVDALAIDASMNGSGIHPVWAVSGNHLFFLKWDSHNKAVIFPNPLPHFPLPFKNVTAMIFDGDRDFLMTGTVAITKNLLKSVMLRMRLGPAHAGMRYLIAASLSSQPPVRLPGGRWINLRSDPLFFLSASGQVPEVFKDFEGITTGEGEVVGRVEPRREWSTALKGVTLYFAGVVLDSPGTIRTVTNSVGLTLF